MSGLDKLGAFTPKAAVNAVAGTPLDAPVADIYPDPNQPRRVFDKDAMQELTDSIKADGVIQPIIVYPSGKGYQIIAGERRWKACKAAGMVTMPVIVRTGPLDSYAQVAENEARDNLKPLELAAFIQRELDAGIDDLKTIASKLKKSKTIVSQLNSLNSAPQAVRDALEQGRLTSSRTANDLMALYKTHDVAALETRISAMPEIGRGDIAGIASEVPSLSRQTAKNKATKKPKKPVKTITVPVSKSDAKNIKDLQPALLVTLGRRHGRVAFNRLAKSEIYAWVLFDDKPAVIEQVRCSALKMNLIAFDKAE